MEKVLILVLGVVLAIHLVQINRTPKLIKQLRFRIIFGVWPDGPGPFVEELVHQELAQRALPFLEACAREEEAIREEIHTYGVTGIPKSLLIKIVGEIQPITRRVKRAERKFRDPQNLAQELGYPALPRATSYLVDSELYEKWLHRGKGAW